MLAAAEEALSISHERSRISLLAVMKDIEIIGEAASRVSAELRLDAPTVPWGDIVGMRNRLIHAYFDVKPKIVWETVDRDLPDLIRELRRQYRSPPASCLSSSSSPVAISVAIIPPLKRFEQFCKRHLHNFPAGCWKNSDRPLPVRKYAS